MFNFLALLDIRVFDRLYLWLLIGLALFLQPGCFCLAFKLQTKLDVKSYRSNIFVLGPSQFLSELGLGAFHKIYFNSSTHAIIHKQHNMYLSIKIIVTRS